MATPLVLTHTEFTTLVFLWFSVLVIDVKAAHVSRGDIKILVRQYFTGFVCVLV